jgi:hypothetical protein
MRPAHQGHVRHEGFLAHGQFQPGKLAHEYPLQTEKPHLTRDAAPHNASTPVLEDAKRPKREAHGTACICRDAKCLFGALFARSVKHPKECQRQVDVLGGGGTSGAKPSKYAVTRLRKHCPLVC